MLAELRSERENLEQAIITLQRLAAGRGKRRGRPPAWMYDGSFSEWSSAKGTAVQK